MQRLFWMKKEICSFCWKSCTYCIDKWTDNSLLFIFEEQFWHLLVLDSQLQVVPTLLIFHFGRISQDEYMSSKHRIGMLQFFVNTCYIFPMHVDRFGFKWNRSPFWPRNHKLFVHTNLLWWHATAAILNKKDLCWQTVNMVFAFFLFLYMVLQK